MAGCCAALIMLRIMTVIKNGDDFVVKARLFHFYAFKYQKKTKNFFNKAKYFSYFFITCVCFGT